MPADPEERYVKCVSKQNSKIQHKLQVFQQTLVAPTRAPLLSRIMKMMKVSNQLCSTIW